MDINRLTEETDARIVAEYIGMEIETRQNQKYHYIRCPGHEKRLGKPDLNIGNAQLKKKGYVCYACGGIFVSTRDMVMEYLNCTSMEAYQIMAEAMAQADGSGMTGAERYADSTTNFQSVPKYRLSVKEAEVIGLYPKFSVIVSRKVVKNNLMPIYDGLMILYQQNPELYYQIIVSKAEETKKKYQYCREHYAAADADTAYFIFNLLGERFDHSVYMQIEREIEERIKICNKIISIFSSKA